jgi:molybdate transport system ATP-binding protein
MAEPRRGAQDRRDMSLSVQIRHAFPGFSLDVDFAAPQGLTVLFGKSGVGQDDGGQCRCGLLDPDQGRIALGDTVLTDRALGVSLPPHRRRLGYVFQDARLFPHLTVQQNLTYGQRFAPPGGARLGDVVDLLGIAPLLARRPGALSGGEKQRVAIGRALLSNPVMLLMDEPLAALDEARKAEILPYIERLRDQVGVPILYISHAMAEVARLATTLVVLEKGRVLRAGPAGELLADAGLAPALGLSEAGAILHARVAGHEADGLTRLETEVGPLWLAQVNAPVGRMVGVRIMAQDVMLARVRPEGLSALNILPGRVTEIQAGGTGVVVQVAVGRDRILAQVTARSAAALCLQNGTEVFAILKAVAVAQGDVGGTDLR